ncbi:unnamed protein product [Echinostoma caproni]|uniref:Uncharacterized protein n=1 Tax=Echinostoma caproni TaxID=27848 RepID=A0A3P8JU93_9TREM|nr:unnamed protein product [Echinostoma caproni]
MDQLQKPRNTVSRLWYSKVLYDANSQTNSNEVKTQEKNENREPNDLVSLLRWSGLRVSTDANLIESVHTTSSFCPKGRYHVAFVRRHSFDCGTIIDSVLLSAQYPPAKLRRTRVRGTLHCGIKLKRRCTESNRIGVENHVALSSHLIPSHLIKPTSAEDGVSWCIVSPSQTPERLYQEPAGWYTSFHSYSVDDTRSSAMVLHSSIAARVKRIPHVAGQETGGPLNGTVATSYSQLDDLMLGDLTDEVLARPRNRVPPRRFDLTDPDLEIALKRSLLEQTPLRKRKSESDVTDSNEGAPGEPQPDNTDKIHNMTNSEHSKRRERTTHGSTFRNHRSQSAPRVVVDETKVPEKPIIDSGRETLPLRDTLPKKAEHNLPSSKGTNPCVNRIANRQGKDQLSCTVTNTSKFIPKLKLAKRSNGKFKILHLARKRKCAIRSRQNLPMRLPLDSTSQKKMEPRVSESDACIQPLTPLDSREPKLEWKKAETVLCSSPLNLSTHNRFTEATDCPEMKISSTDIPPALLCMQDFTDKQPISQVHNQYLGPPVLDRERLVQPESNGHSVPLTMWTKLKNPLPAPEQFTKTGSKKNIPKILPQTSMVSNCDILPTMPTDNTPRFGNVVESHYPEDRVPSQHSNPQPSLSTMYVQVRNDPVANFGRTHPSNHTSKMNSLNAVAPPNSIQCASHPHMMLTGMNPSTDSSSIRPSTLNGVCCPPPFVQSINTSISGLTFPVKPPVPYAIPQVTTPVVFPNVVPTWPPMIRAPCDVGQETPVQMTPTWADTIPASMNNVTTSMGKADAMSTMFFLQSAIPPQPAYGCNLMGPGWAQPHDVNSPWPMVQSLPPVQFIT